MNTSTTQKIAKAIRVVTIPPVFVGLLLIGCSSIGTMACIIRFFGPLSVAPCVLVGAATMWASLKLGRHTAAEFILGAAIGVAAFFISGIIIL